MPTLIIILLILGLLAVGVVAWGFSAYNGFIKSRNVIQESWRQIDVELNRRYELIPNLVETVRAYAGHERNTLEEVTRLRSQAVALSQASSTGVADPQRAEVEQQLSGAVQRLVVSSEAYPELRSNENFLELQRQLADTEDRIAAGRRFYNANVRAYNTKVESVPSNIVANMFHFEKATYFEVNDQAVRQAPDVNFGEISQRPSAAPEPPQQQIQAPRHDDVTQPYQPPQRAQEPPAQPAVPPSAQAPGQEEAGGYRPPFSS